MTSDVKELVEALKPLVEAADDLSFGADWNNGIHAKTHGYRQKLLDALPAARAALKAISRDRDGVAVKPLEWIDISDDGICLQSGVGDFRYTIRQHTSGNWCGYANISFGLFATKDAAKIAVQEAHERTVKSALASPISPTAPDKDAEIEELRRQLEDAKAINRAFAAGLKDQPPIARAALTEATNE